MKGVVYPENEAEMPEFIARADEILEAQLEAEHERIRILNRTPVPFLTHRQQAKKLRAAKRKQLKNQYDYNLPAWFIEEPPLEEDQLNFVDDQKQKNVEEVEEEKETELNRDNLEADLNA